jgi:hypothetical protein
MRERGKKTYALIGGKMVKFSQRAKYEAWFRAEILSRDLPHDSSEWLTTEEVFATLEDDFRISDLRAKVTRKRK